MKHKILFRHMYDVSVTLRTTAYNKKPKEFTFKSYNLPWLDIQEKTLFIAEIKNNYIEDLEHYTFDTRNLYEIVITQNNNILQIITLNDKLITPKEIREIEKDKEE